MTEVTSLLKPECPCGCGAVGAPIKSTGHSKGCTISCPTCARPKAKGGSKSLPVKTRRALYQRSQGMCEARIPEVCHGSYEHAHHKRRRSQGGTDALPNLLAVCGSGGCHDWIHAHPEEAMARGFLIPAQEPLSSAVTKVTPVERTTP